MKSLGALCVAMILYALVVVPIVEPANSQPAQTSLFTPELPTEHWWQGFFPEDSWQCKSPEIINTNRGILLAKKSEEVDDRTIRFKPITIIMPQTQAGRDAIERNELGAVTRQDMWIVSAEEGATIHFEEPISNFGGSVPKIKRGELSGAIEVSRQVASEAEEKPWRLRTRDLTINQTQLTTRNEVLIEWGDSIVQGRDLLIRLRSDLLGKEGTVSPAWGPLDELELYQVQKIDVALPPGGLWADLDPNQLQSDLHPDLSRMPARLQASCGGRFSFDFKNSTATMRNGVQVKHFIGNLQPDQFSCERIAIFLDPPERSDAFAAKPRKKGEASLGGIRLLGFVAIGADSLENFVAEKSVIIDAPTVGMNAKCKRLEVDLQEGKVKFNGKLDSPESTQSAVVLRYQGNEFRSPNIEYKVAPRRSKNSSTSNEGMPSEQPAEHLGWLVADGPGELKTAGEAISEMSLGAAHVRWQESLKMAPAPDGVGAQWIEVTGNTLVESADHGFLTSNRIEVWLEEYEEVEASVLSKGKKAASNLSSRLRPLRVFSSEVTELSTPRIHAQVNELDLRIEYHQNITSPAEEPEGLALSDSEGNPMYQWIGPSSNAENQGLLPSPAKDEEDSLKMPVRIVGSNLKATIAQRGRVNWIPRFELQGPVTLKQDQDPQNKSIPWEVNGTVLLLATNPEGEADLQIQGAPAQMKIADGVLKGESVRFNQMHSVIFMDCPGEFSLPRSLLKQGGPTVPPQSHMGSTQLVRTTPTNQDLSSIEWLKNPLVTWQGRMHFDGAVVHIEKDVEFEAAMRSAPDNDSPAGLGKPTNLDSIWLAAGRSNSMQIHLVQPVDLKAEQTEQPTEVELDRIVLDGKVEILASELAPDGEKRSREEIHVPSMTFHMKHQEIVAAGPGWMHSRFLSKRQLGQLAGGSVEEQLQGAYLTFRDSMVALMESQQLTLEGRVELLSAPLKNWDDSAVPGENHQLSKDQMLLNCDQLKVYDTSGLSTSQRARTASSRTDSWEFRATGDVAFNGSSAKGQYLGNGYQLTYSRSKNLLMLRGDGRKPGYLQSVPQNSEDGQFKAYLESVAIDPETLSILDLQLGQGGVQLESGNSGQGADALAPQNSPNQVPGFQPSRSVDPRGIDFYRSGR